MPMRALNGFRAKAAAIAAAIALLGCAAPDNRTPQERADDGALAQRLQAALAAARYVDADHVTVDVRRGVAIVSGIVGDAQDLRGVLRVCWSVPGVRSVEDQLEIYDPVWSMDSGSDSGTGSR